MWDFRRISLNVMTSMSCHRVQLENQLGKWWEFDIWKVKLCKEFSRLGSNEWQVSVQLSFSGLMSRDLKLLPRYELSYTGILESLSWPSRSVSHPLCRSAQTVPLRPIARVNYEPTGHPLAKRRPE